MSLDTRFSPGSLTSDCFDAPRSPQPSDKRFWTSVRARTLSQSFHLWSSEVAAGRIAQIESVGLFLALGEFPKLGVQALDVLDPLVLDDVNANIEFVSSSLDKAAIYQDDMVRFEALKRRKVKDPHTRLRRDLRPTFG